MTAPAPRTLNVRAICEALGIKEVTLHGYVRRGCPCDLPAKRGRGQSKMFNESEMRAWLRKEGLTARVGRPPAVDVPTDPAALDAALEVAETAGDDDDGPEGAPEFTELSQAKLEKERWLGRIAKLKALQTEGRLIDSEEAQLAWAAEGARLKAAILAIPTRVAPRLVGLQSAHEAMTVVQAELRAVLAQLATKAPTGGEPA